MRHGTNMKHVLRLGLMAMTLLVGTQAASAAPIIAEFRWFQNRNPANLSEQIVLTNVDSSQRAITNVLVLYYYGDDPDDGYSLDEITATMTQPPDQAAWSWTVQPPAPSYPLAFKVDVSFVFDGNTYTKTLEDKAGGDPNSTEGDLLAVEGGPIWAAGYDFVEQTSQVPEPFSLALLALGGTAAVLRRRA